MDTSPADALRAFPWPIMVVTAGGEASASVAFRELLHVEGALPAAVPERFALAGLAGRPLTEDELPWKRAARGQVFSEEQMWRDRLTGERLLLTVRCQPWEGAALLSFENIGEHPLLLRRSQLTAAIAAGVLVGQDPWGMAQGVVGDMAGLVGAEALFLMESASQEQCLRLLASVGLPQAFDDDHRSVSLELPGLLSLTARTQAVQEIADIQRLPAPDFDSTRKLLDLGFRSMVTAPLLEHGDLLGVLGLAWRHTGRLTTLERRTLDGVVAACALGLRYARLRAAERREAERLRILRDAALATEAPLPLTELLRRLVEQARAMTGARYGALGVLNQAGNGLSDFVYSGLPEALERAIGHLPEGRGLLGVVIREARPIRVAAIDRDARSVGFPRHHPAMTTFLGVPLRVGHEVFGNLYLCDKEAAAEFTDDDEQLLELFGAQSALAIGYARQLEATRKAQEGLARVHQEFSAVIAHDLRSPVSTILLQVDSLLRDRPGDEHITVARKTLERLRRSARRITEMTNDLLDVSRLELSRMPLDKRLVDPVPVVEALLAQLAPTLMGRQVSLQVHGELPRVLVDPARFDQVLTNLIENAAKYSPPNTPISITIEAAEGGAVLTVEDRGPGIAPEEIPELFNRFYQAPRARAHKSGLGLGLYIAKGLVECHGGRIWVDSRPGEGSRFHVWMPGSGNHGLEAPLPSAPPP